MRPACVCVRLAVLLAACADDAGGHSRLNGDGAAVGAGATDAAPPNVVFRCVQLPAEAEPNDTRGQSTPYTLGVSLAGCIGDGQDRDYFDLGGATRVAGYYQIALADVGRGSLAARVFAVSDNGEITSQFAANEGQTLNLFFAAAAGQRYRLEVRDFAGFTAPYFYALTATFEAVDDRFEPNDSKSDAKGILVGQPASAFAFAGFIAGATIAPEAYDDWYRVTLAKDAVTLRLENVPTSVPPDVSLLDAQGSEIARAFDTTRGAGVMLRKSLTQGGDYLVKVSVFAPVPPAEGKGTVLPDHFTRPYKLTVTQP